MFGRRREVNIIMSGRRREVRDGVEAQSDDGSPGLSQEGGEEREERRAPEVDETSQEGGRESHQGDCNRKNLIGSNIHIEVNTF